MMHQLPHLDHAGVLAGTRRAFVGQMGIEPEGSIVRLDAIHRKAMQAMANRIPPDVRKQQVVLKSLFVWIPFRSLLLLDARQFHGGHYGNKGVFRFHCVISDFDFGQKSWR